MCDNHPNEVLAYRVDRRQFQRGDRINPSDEYLQALTPLGQQLEAFLEEARPANRPQRHTSLFVFEAPEPARLFWTKMTNSKLYTVRLLSPVLHSGDMALSKEQYEWLRAAISN